MTNLQLWLHALWLKAILITASLTNGRGFRTNESGALDPGEWAYLFVSVVVLVLIIAALFPVLTGALGDYADNETTFGPILVVIVPLVIGAAILLAVVGVFLGKARGGGM